MAEEISELELASLKRRVSLIESEMRVFTPPISRLERDLWEFRAEVNQRLDNTNQRLDRGLSGLHQRLDGTNQRLDSVNQSLDGFRKEFVEFKNQVLSLLREFVDKAR